MWVLICNYIIVYRCMIYYFTSVCKYMHICVCVYVFPRFVIYGLRLRFAIAQSSGKLTEAIAILSALKSRLCQSLCVCVLALVPVLNNQWRSSALVRLLSSCCCCCYCITCIFMFFAAHSTHTHTRTQRRCLVVVLVFYF